MINYKIVNATDRFFEEHDNKWTYKYKGKDYELTPENLPSMSSGLQQSFGHYCAKECPDPQGRPKQQPGQKKIKKARPVPISRRNDSQTKGGTYKPDDIKDGGKNKLERVKAELKRLAMSEKIVEEKLNYPRVFQALLTEPHTALDHRKKTVEEHFQMTLIVDTNVRYMQNHGTGPNSDTTLPNTLIEAAKQIKGITVFAGNALHLLTYKGRSFDYYTDLIEALPLNLRKNVVVFTQGCGSMGHYNHTKKGAVRFLTPFDHGRNCGCPQIAKAAAAGQKMFYAIRNSDSLKLVK